MSSLDASTAAGPARARHNRLATWWRRGWRLFVAVYLVVLAVGLVAFITHETPLPLTPDLRGETLVTDGDRVNWALYLNGGRVRASEWDQFNSHHPLYIIDGDPEPHWVEKWMSRHQRFPWVDVVLPEAHDIDEVVLRHAGWREGHGLSHDRYTIRCYRGDEQVAELGVVRNLSRISSYPLACTGVDRVRVQFDCTGVLAAARLYEIELWGPR